MSRPSKLKRAIKEIENEVERYRTEIKVRENAISNNLAIIEGLKRIDGEKNEENNKD